MIIFETRPGIFQLLISYSFYEIILLHWFSKEAIYELCVTSIS